MIKPKHMKLLLRTKVTGGPRKDRLPVLDSGIEIKGGKPYCSLGSRLLVHKQQKSKLTGQENLIPNTSWEESAFLIAAFNLAQRSDNGIKSHLQAFINSFHVIQLTLGTRLFLYTTHMNTRIIKPKNLVPYN